MRNSKRDTKIFLLDTNVFIVAIKDLKKETQTLGLILRIIEREDIRLVADEFLVEEMIRYAEEFKSETASWIFSALLEKMELVDVGENFIKICKGYIETPNMADILHAACCLKSDAILISNDRHFDKIRNEGIIKAWSISKVIKEFR
ncbi:MAG: type II toxin-antitoxin system VapC family toxin [Thermoplasmata archaeon]|nr:MAG: type II toxin-antitoxin system VapC family toxin [Thermoplasmata archaeon]